MAMNIGQQAAASLTGNVETAFLVIYDRRGKGKEEKATAADLMKASVDALLNGVTEVSPFPGSKEHMLKVQFNPSELTLNASAVPRSERDSATDKSVTLAMEDAKLTLTTKLYFDDMQVYDAFMWDKFTAGLTAEGAANAASAIRGKTHSVQGHVESLIAALRNPYTRAISFRWADFSFVGQLNTVRANYTMFSTSGRPIRAEVLLRIQHIMEPGKLYHWYENFLRAFGGSSNNLTKVEQTTENLLNLTL